MTVRFSVISEPNLPRTVSKEVVQDTGKKLIAAVRAALARVNGVNYAADADFRKFFCAATKADQAATVRNTVLAILGAMDRFLSETSNTVTVKLMGKHAEAGDYGYVFADLGRIGEVGQWFIYLGPQFNSDPLQGSGVRDVRLLTMAHELSHHFGTNSAAGYKTEHYDDDALKLPATNPVYAANNADNYGYFIEAIAA